MKNKNIIYIKENAFYVVLVLLFFSGCLVRTTEVTKSSNESCSFPDKISPPVLSTQEYHVIQEGETLWSIASQYGVTVEDIVQKNNIANPQRITMGEKLLIPAYPFNDEARFSLAWPFRGTVVGCYGEILKNRLNKGLCLESDTKQVVKSSAPGYVKFSRYLKGYGYTVIIQHSRVLSTVYANLTSVFLQEGSYVKKGQPIGEAGFDQDSRKYSLHFEVRENALAKDPYRYLTN